MNIEELFKDRSKEEISAFAFNVGRSLETFLKAETKDMAKRNQDLEARILEFRTKIREKGYLSLGVDVFKEVYDQHFGIINKRVGQI